jgi:hypothetical protein
MQKFKNLLRRKDLKKKRGINRIEKFIRSRFDVKESTINYIPKLTIKSRMKNKVIFKKVWREIKDYLPKTVIRGLNL